MVLPQDPSAAPPPGMTPIAVPDASQDDALGDIFGGGMAAGGDMGKRVGCTGKWSWCWRRYVGWGVQGSGHGAGGDMYG